MSEFAPGSTTPTATLTGLERSECPGVRLQRQPLRGQYGNNTVSEFAPGSTTPTATLTGLNDPGALAFDSSGNLYVANADNNTVSEFTPASLATPTAGGVVIRSSLPSRPDRAWAEQLTPWPASTSPTPNWPRFIRLPPAR